MKNIIITSKIIKRELLIWLATLVFAQLLNVYSIAKFKTEWSELYTQLGYVLALSVVFYFVLWIVRLLFGLFKKR
ncbi:MAG TPA: hypothetical protein VJY41_11260 [Prolixibacteraceae bacterium]|nr:hypothetical protein [Prolixibacteraceae bacterium]